MRGLEVACPPIPASSTTRVVNPSEAPYTAADSPAGPGADDHEVEIQPLQMHRRARRPGYVEVARIGQHRPVGKDDQRERCPLIGPSDKGPPIARVGQAERVRDSAAPQGVPQLIGAAGPRLSDHVNRMRGRAPRLRPLEQQARNGLMEELIRRLRGPEDVVVDPAVGHRVEDRLPRLRVSPPTPGDQQAALGVRVEVTRRIQQLASGHPREPLSRQHQGDVVAGGGNALEAGERLGRRWQGQDAVVAPVAVAQLALDISQSVRILLNSHERRARHAPTLLAVARRRQSEAKARRRGVAERVPLHRARHSGRQPATSDGPATMPRSCSAPISASLIPSTVARTSSVCSPRFGARSGGNRAASEKAAGEPGIR